MDEKDTVITTLREYNADLRSENERLRARVRELEEFINTNPIGILFQNTVDYVSKLFG